METVYEDALLSLRSEPPAEPEAYYKVERQLRATFPQALKPQHAGASVDVRVYFREKPDGSLWGGLALLGGIGGLAGPAGGGRDEVERRDEIVRALGRLPAVHRQVLVMKYLDGLSVSAIADELGRSPVQVQSLLQRARDGLRRALEGDPGD